MISGNLVNLSYLNALGKRIILDFYSNRSCGFVLVLNFNFIFLCRKNIIFFSDSFFDNIGSDIEILGSSNSSSICCDGIKNSTADTLKANGCLLCAEAIAMSSGINIEIVQRELAVMARKQLVYLDSIAGISDSLYSSDVLEEDILLGNIISEQIIEKIQQLPAPLPRILLLKIFYGVTYKEIGERLGIEPGQIYNLYRAGIELLKKQIKKML